LAKLLRDLENKGRAGDKADSVDSEACSAEESDDETVQKTRKRRTKKEMDGSTGSGLGRFVKLTDMLPPLPKKGDFNVETIKRSQYFFS
jgi:DNA-directed RNA polymerase